MYIDKFDIAAQELNPTFLFTWKGIRLEDEKNYHSHDYLELAIILSGKGKYYIENKMYPVEEGDVIILNPNTHHQSLIIDTAFPTIEFFVGFTDIEFNDIEKNHFPLVKDNPILHTSVDCKRKLFKLCAAIQTENEILLTGRYFMLRSYLIQMLLLLIREQAEPIERTKGYSFDSVNKKYVVEQIISYFEEHYHEKISLDQIAENMYLSIFYISKIFKSETGDTPIRYLINIRLDKAKELIEKGQVDSIQSVATSVGYEDVYHFSKLFKKRFGISPSKIKSSKNP